MNVRPLVFVDTETTGLGPHRQAWEVAAIRRDVDGTETSLEFFMPVDASKAEPGALNVGGYYSRHPDGIAVATRAPQTVGPVPAPPVHRPAAVPMHRAAEKIAAFTAGATLIGANPAFDAQVLERIVRSAHLEPRWHFRLIDVEVMAMQELGLPDVPGLAKACGALGIPFDRQLAHAAMYDTRAARALFDLLTDMTATRLAGLSAVAGA